MGPFPLFMGGTGGDVGDWVAKVNSMVEPAVGPVLEPGDASVKLVTSSVKKVGVAVGTGAVPMLD